jgi:putative DNA primase/helicase
MITDSSRAHKASGGRGANGKRQAGSGRRGATLHKPESLRVRSEVIPEVLQALPQWVVWSYVKEVDADTGAVDWNKPPRNVRTGRLASSTDPKTWSTYEVALAAYRRGREGLGFVLHVTVEQRSANRPWLVAVDLDHCRDPGTGRIEPWAEEIVGRLNTYTEVSPSGHGLRLFVLGRLPPFGRKKGRYENYETGRYVTVTGQHVEGTPGTIEHRQAEVEEVHRGIFGNRPPAEAQPRSPAGAPSLLDDVEVIRRAGAAKNGAKFRRLWSGVITDYASASEADLGLVNLLAFWTGPDAERLTDLFAQSGLMRSKWNREDYRRRTIEKALEGRTEFYAPGGHGGASRGTPGGGSGQSPAAAGANGRGGGEAPGADGPRGEPHRTDLGNAHRMVREHGGDLRHCHPWKKWLCWDGKRWRPDDTGEPVRRAKQTVTRLYCAALEDVQAIGAELEELGEADERGRELKARLARAQKMMSWALTSEAAPRLAAMAELARSEPGIPVVPGDLDGQPWLLNCVNGTVELRTGAIREHRREDYLTGLCPTEFRPEAPCPAFERFLAAVFQRDGDLPGFVQRLLGRCLTGDVSEQILPIFWGKGANGKSTLLNTVLSVLGTDYAMKAPADLLMTSRGDRHPTELADLFGKRLVVASETRQGRHLNESLIKDLTGGERIRARGMRENFWEFPPTHKVILQTNHKPAVPGGGHGMWRRLRLVPFDVRFSDPDEPENRGRQSRGEPRADKQLDLKLAGEREGILAWLVRGCLEWQRQGLGVPESVAAATAAYRAGEDVLARFLAEKCMRGPDYSCRGSVLYDAYKGWAAAAGERPMSGKVFGEQVADQAGITKKVSNGVWYLGVEPGEPDPGAGAGREPGEDD